MISPPSTDPRPIYVVGQGKRSEFRASIRPLPQGWDDENGELEGENRIGLGCVHCADLNLLQQRLQMDLPDAPWIVLLQSHPDEFDRQQVISLQAEFPHAEWICVVGHWSEGEGRTGRPLPNLERVRIGQTIWRVPWFFPAEPTSVGAGVESLPLHGLLVGIVSDLPSHREMLLELIVEAGGKGGIANPAHPRQTVGFDLLVWHMTGTFDQQQSRLDRLQCSFPQLPIVGIATFPRMKNIQYWRERGMTAIIPQPFLLEDLIRACQSCRPNGSSSMSLSGVEGTTLS